MIVNVKTNPRGTHDIYINNRIGLVLDLLDSNNIKESERAPLLAINACLPQRHNKESIPRHKMAARHKLWAEGWLKETKMILGWLWDFWQLIISLPHNKYIAWMGEINKMINERLVTTKNLESTIGRLTHILMIIPFVHHVLSCLCELDLRSKRNNCCCTQIPQLCINDLKLMETCFVGHA